MIMTSPFKTFPTIFKKTSTGKTQQWAQELNPDNLAQYRTVTGQVGGKITRSAWTTAEGTNVGRANERTPEQQAIFEIEANYTKKLDKEYHTSADTIDEAKKFLPMLAKDFGDHWKKVKPGTIVFSQPKLDGMRCVIKKDGMWSRGGKPIVSCPHIINALKPFFEADPNLILDGELYNHDLHDNFDELMSIFKQLKPKQHDLDKAKQWGQYHVYDIPSVDGLFSKRTEALAQLFMNNKPDCIHIVETSSHHDIDSIDQEYSKYVEAGYEGQMIRLDAKYVTKRTDQLLKRKEMIDKEYKLVDIVEGKGNWAGYAKSTTFLIDPNGPVTDENTFDAGVSGSQEYTKQILKDKDLYIGTMCTVQHFPQLTPKGKPRFPVVKEFNRTDNL